MILEAASSCRPHHVAAAAAAATPSLLSNPKAVLSLKPVSKPAFCGAAKSQFSKLTFVRGVIRLRAAVGEDGVPGTADDEHARNNLLPEDVVVEKPVAPLKPGTPAGQFLMETLLGNPHLFHAAAEQQLEQLEEERISQQEQQYQQQTPVSSDHVLYKRIAQLKSEERRRAVQEVIYALVVQKFIKAGIKMVLKVSALLNKDLWPIQEKDLQSVHSSESFEMIKEHMERVLGGQATLSRVDPQTVVQISKLRVGQIYATSVMYGYFLKRVDERFQLEKKMKILTTAGECGQGVSQFLSIEKRKVSSESTQQAADDELLLDRPAPAAAAAQVAVKSNDLRSYVAKFDHETLSRYATMRTHETVDLIERHAEALFGRPDLKVGPDGIVGLAKDDGIQIKFVSLKALVLEAAAFGSYLWEVESYVDQHYKVVPRRV